MAYNLQTLITILEQILDPEQTRWTLGLCEPQLESLLEKAASLQKILANPSLSLLRIQTLESQITKAVHEAENTIESHMVDRILSGTATKWLKAWGTFPDLQQPMRELDAATEQALKLVELEAAMASSSEVVEDDSSSSSSHVTSSKSVVVGADEDLLLLKDRLTGMERKLEIIPIVGMGGIGKTTLARKLYQDPLITHHFKYARAWATISQDYNMKAILSSLIRCVIGRKKFDDEKHVDKKISDLKVILHQSLYGIRYMIVLDDIWSVKFLDEIRMYFPNHNNGSRIVITTRESGMATYADPESVQHQVELLSKPESWNLLRQIVFGEEESCPDELQRIGEKIASDCGGLPLAINVVGGLLSKVERSQDAWKRIASDVKAAIAESDKQFSNILSLSYNHLPNHLKPCFLYMGSAFPEDYQIKASRLVRLWVAEGFVKLPYNDKSLEEEAGDYINALVQRNLVMVTQNKCNGKAKRITVHDMLRDLCIRKSHDEKFLQVASCSPSREPTFFNPRRVSVGTIQAMKNVVASAELMPGARSIVSTGPIQSPLFSSLTLLRVLDIYETDFRDFPDEILQLVNLRYLAIHCNSSIPSGITRLCNLQTLIVYLRSRCFLPWDIWGMSELRRVEVHEADGFKAKGGDWRKRSVLNKLHSFSPLKLTPWLVKNGILERFPNIKKLSIFPEGTKYVSVDLSHLHKLETLTCNFGYMKSLHISGFPSSLRKLNIYRGDDRSMFRDLCRLPNLEVLVVCNYKRGCGYRPIMEQWELEEGDEFGSLQYLRLDSLDLARWKADETNFPVLRHLIVRRCKRLKEIPSGIGEIPTLELIEMLRCTNSLVASARKIQEEQQSDYGNYNLQLRILDYRTINHTYGFRTLCKLPNLEVLTVRGCVFETVKITEEWKTVVKEWELAKGDEFGSLKYLRLEELGLVRWIADETNFPVLRHLVVRRCNRLKEIPSGIGGIPTLKLIEMHGCSDSAVASVRKIQEEQRSDYDDYHLQLRIS